MADRDQPSSGNLGSGLVHEALRREHAYFESLFEGAPEAIVMTRNDGTVLHVNNEFERLFGYERDEACGEYIDDLVASPERRDEARALTDDVARGGRAQVEAVRRRRDGREVPVSIRTAPVIVDGEQVGVFAIYRDITVRLAAEEEQRRLEVQVAYMQRLESLGAVVSGIANDFNNILTGILGNAELALARVHDDGELRSMLETIRDAGHRAAGLCGLMMGYAGQGRFLVQPLDLTEQVRAVVERVGPRLPEGVQLELDLDDDLPLVDADPGQIERALRNLLDNAVEALGEDGGTVRVGTSAHSSNEWYLDEHTLVGQVPAGPTVTLVVSDSGRGMDEALRHQVFDPFFSTHSDSRGLGLTAVLGIVRGHHGAIQLESQPGAGSTIQLLFPARPEGRQSLDADEHTSSLGELVGGGTVLLVDDEEFILLVASRILEQLGFDVVAVRSGREAVAAFEQADGDFACALIDLTMDEMDGVETLQALRRYRRDIPVLLTSGAIDPELEQRLAGHEHSGFLQKPFVLADLRRALRDTLEV